MFNLDVAVLYRAHTGYCTVGLGYVKEPAEFAGAALPKHCLAEF